MGDLSSKILKRYHREKATLVIAPFPYYLSCSLTDKNRALTWGLATIRAHKLPRAHLIPFLKDKAWLRSLN